MVGKTRLFQQTRSPLIQGMTRRKRPLWPWLLTVALVVIAAAAAWWFLIR